MYENVDVCTCQQSLNHYNFFTPFLLSLPLDIVFEMLDAIGTTYVYDS